MQPVIEQATQALQLGRFETVKNLTSTALETSETADTRQALFEILAQAQAGLQDHAAAIEAWQEAYRHATTPDDKARVFEQARQAMQDQQAYEALLTLAQAHLEQTRTPQERASCLLAAGEALVHLQRYQEARQQYLEPAMELPGILPETRLHLWHYLGLSHLAEHTFLEAAAAFRQSADLALGQHFAAAGAQVAAQRTQLHHLRNAARFYEGIVHLIYQHPQQAIQSFQELQRPLTTVGTLNVALFIGLAHRALLQPEAALRAVQTLARSATLQGPAAIVRAGIATLQESPSVVGEHLEAAIGADLHPRTSWEPSWRALLYRELALAFQQLGCRDAAITCYEDALQVVVQRLDPTRQPQIALPLRGASLLTALAERPCETWSAAVQGEMFQILQPLAWLYRPLPDSALASQAFDLALRVARTPEQEAALWCQRGWFQATGLLAMRSTTDGAATPHATLVAALQQAQTTCQDTPLAQAATGVLALLQEDTAQAMAAFAELVSVPDLREVQTLCVAAWLWVHTHQDTLAASGLQPTGATVSVWQMPRMLASALEILLAWAVQHNATTPAIPWLALLLTQQPGPTLEALRVLCRPGYLPATHQAALLEAITQLSEQPEHAAVNDQLAVLLGGASLVSRVETFLAAIDQQLTAPVATSGQAGRQRKQRPRREATPAAQIATEMSQVLHLITLLHSTSQATGESALPTLISGWLARYSQLCAHAPEVVGALLGLLRQCPGAAAVIPTILERVALSRRQRQALEAAQQALPETVSSDHVWLAWEEMPQWPLGRLLETLSDVRRPTGTRADTAVEARTCYIAALIFARAGLPHRAVVNLQHCLRLQPGQPLAHYKLAQLLSEHQQAEAAFDHLLQAWRSLEPMALHMPVLALALLNQLLRLFTAAQQYDQFPEWIATFERQQQALQGQTFLPAQQQRLAEEEGEFALTRATYLASLPASETEQPVNVMQQLTLLNRAVSVGTLQTRQTALHHQAALQTRLYRYDAALATYAALLQQWPEDLHALQRHDLLLALQSPAREPSAVGRLLTEALASVFSSLDPTPQSLPQTPTEALTWLQQASKQLPQTADVIDLLTMYAGIALQRQEIEPAIAMLTPLADLTRLPQQAFYLATAYYLRSTQISQGTEALRDCEQALRSLRLVLLYEPVIPQAPPLLQQIEHRHTTLSTVRQQEQTRAVYRRQICGIFAQHGVRFQDSAVDRRPEAAWVDIVEMADLDETNGRLVTTVYLYFNNQVAGTTPAPDEADITLYAQHQRDKQRLVEMHGMEALQWPHTAYEGSTDFATLFPERLGLNRDLLFIAFADPHALIRYARVLQTVTQGLPQLQEGTPVPDSARLAAAARYLALVSLLRQRLQTLTTMAPSKAVQRQMSELGDALTAVPTPAYLHHCPAFVDAYGYFHAIVEAMRAHLDAPPVTERATEQPEERQPQRPTRRRRRAGKERWREGDGERRYEENFSDVL